MVIKSGRHHDIYLGIHLRDNPQFEGGLAVVQSMLFHYQSSVLDYQKLFESRDLIV